MSKPILILTMEHSGAQEVRCYDNMGKVVLVLEDSVDVAPMAEAGLDPHNDSDLFTYANHLLGGRFATYTYNAI